MNRGLKKDFNLFFSFFNRAARFDKKIDRKIIKFIEFDRMAEYANKMLRDRKQIAEALRESEEKYRSMMETMTDQTYISSHDFRIEYMNPAMIAKVGRDATGEICHKVIYNMDEICPWCVFDRVQQKEHVKSEETDPKDNSHYSVINSPISHADGRVSKLTILRDITEMKTIEENLRQAQKMESIGTLTGGYCP
ncbi:MAG: hypothetical protein GY860_16055 [Desulfobacteraceae bacterium]|nr:hypothetical protein [Desulfobacteraceae bacterium]